MRRYIHARLVFGWVMLLAAVQVFPQYPQKTPIISAYPGGQGPGKIKLLPGYVAGNPEGTSCFDTECGEISSPQGLTIGYDIGTLGGVRVQDDRNGVANSLWFGQTEINSQAVRYSVTGARAPRKITLSFPNSYSNFFAKIENEADLQTFLRIVLTYQGPGFEANPESTLGGRLVTDKGVPLAGVEMQLRGTRAQNTTKTKENGQFTMTNLQTGQYELFALKNTSYSCQFTAKPWKIAVSPASIILKSFVVRCR